MLRFAISKVAISGNRKKDNINCKMHLLTYDCYNFFCPRFDQISENQKLQHMHTCPDWVEIVQKLFIDPNPLKMVWISQKTRF